MVFLLVWCTQLKMFTSNLVLVLVIYFTLSEGTTRGPPDFLESNSGKNSYSIITEDFTESGANNGYYLYTRTNLNEPQKITFGDKDSLMKSNYDADKELVVIVHGWASDRHSPVNEVVKSSYLKVTDVNVIVVDWGDSQENYVRTSLRVPSTGRYLGNFVQWVFDTAGGDWDRVHLVGYSLGAHVVGNAGREVGGLPKRITGLDPAGPLWGHSYSLDTNAGQYVEVIHTCAIRRGAINAIGHVDFYPNGGTKQPGCEDATCAHDRAYELFASSLENSHLIGRQCMLVSFAVVGACFGDTLVMGNTDLSKTGSGIYYLSTNDSWPF
ncbi:pancreatic lipase-related protein 2-like [Aricia agestis]|uniref:pancreatic lipase-related protein 2-like n=1 Tax=Aricia agestis TaxID=91739 RepID=UPI001C201B6E|nr:pancreatic lipase-related protein 2-like [Aricia agestis]